MREPHHSHHCGTGAYTIVAAEEENYVRRVAGHVDNKVQEVLSSGRASLVESVVLAALNIADEYYKEQEASENLRRQLKGRYLGGGHQAENGALRGRAGRSSSSRTGNKTPRRDAGGLRPPVFCLYPSQIPTRRTYAELLLTRRLHGGRPMLPYRTAPTPSTWDTAISAPAATRRTSPGREFAAAALLPSRGCKVYLTLNTLLGDREPPASAGVYRRRQRHRRGRHPGPGPGVLRMVRQAAPDMPIHAPPRMTVHNLDGVKKMADFA